MAGIIAEEKLGGVPQSASRHVAMSTCYDIYGAGGIQIGFMSQINISHTRTVTQIRHLNSVDAGIAVDSTVTPDAPTISFNGFYVYNPSTTDQKGLDNTTTGTKLTTNNAGTGTSVGRLAAIDLMMTLDQQRVPFDIVVRHVYANDVVDGGDTAKGKIVAVYKKCTISAMAIPINVGTAAVSDSGSVSVGFVGSVEDGN